MVTKDSKKFLGKFPENPKKCLNFQNVNHSTKSLVAKLIVIAICGKIFLENLGNVVRGCCLSIFHFNTVIKL